jgi:DNA-binding beta-propeller fold protein YncE
MRNNQIYYRVVNYEAIKSKMMTKKMIKTDRILLDGLLTAPEFPDGMDWLNTAKPLKMKDLRGKMVLLDFWTYCCINCMHIIPDLKKLEKEYPDELVVIGVHSAKFLTERETENINNAALRYEIVHPIVNDRDMEIWSAYGVRAWPTLVLVNPIGRIIGSVSGEGIYDFFSKLISDAIAHFKKKGSLHSEPVKFTEEKVSLALSLLSFPGKVLADEKDHILFISDSNNNRIIGMDIEDNSIKFAAGSGERGWKDGGFEDAQFNHPQGLAYDFQYKTLYVADTENHLIRKIDLQSRKVMTIAGTGRQGGSSDSADDPLEISLNSPWDVAILGDELYIAMAGSHQIWKYDLATNRISRFAGSGREGLFDGNLLRSALAQPSGITTDSDILYFADSETSSIRLVDIRSGGEVKTIVGQDLFIFGDRDGIGDSALLQHPLGVAFYGKNLYIADTYNNKIKAIDPVKRISKTLFGSGRAGFKDGKDQQAELNEPGGVTAAFGMLYIADTNNHAIRICDLETSEVSTVVFSNPEKLAFTHIKPEKIRIEEQRTIRAGTSKMTINIALPPGGKFNPEAPSSIKISSKDAKIISFDQNSPDILIKNPETKREIEIISSEGKTQLTIEAMIFYCSENNRSNCFSLSDNFSIPLEIKKNSGDCGLVINLGT